MNILIIKIHFCEIHKWPVVDVNATRLRCVLLRNIAPCNTVLPGQQLRTTESYFVVGDKKRCMLPMYRVTRFFLPAMRVAAKIASCNTAISQETQYLARIPAPIHPYRTYPLQQLHLSLPPSEQAPYRLTTLGWLPTVAIRLTSLTRSRSSFSVKFSAKTRHRINVMARNDECAAFQARIHTTN